MVRTVEALVELINDTLEYCEGTDELGVGAISTVRTFEEAGLITSDQGLVVRTQLGEEFQVTVKRSR